MKTLNIWVSLRLLLVCIGFLLSSLSPTHAQCTRNCGITPTASLTANGLQNITVGVGSTIAYHWSSANAVSATSSYTVDGGVPNPWAANSLIGSLSGIVAASQAGHTYVITYAAKDSYGETAFAQVTITVVNRLTASLIANGLHNIAVGVGSTITYDWSSANAVSAVSSYTVDGGLPSPWVADNLSGSSSGMIAASQAGHIYVITYAATNSIGQTATDQVTITVVNRLTASLIADGLHSITVGVGSAIAYNWSSANAVSAASSYTVDGGAPSPWVANSLTGSLSATVSASQVGHTYVITYTTTNSIGQMVSDEVIITVVNSPAVSLLPGSMSFSCVARLVDGGCTPPQTASLMNTESSPLHLREITISGPYFSQTNNCPSSLEPGQSCAIEVSFDGPASRTQIQKKTYTGSLFVTDSATPGTQGVSLTGTTSGVP